MADSPAALTRRAAATPRAVARWRALGLLIRAMGAASALGGVLTFLVPATLGRFGGEFEDFGIQLRAGAAVATGGDPYATFTPHAGSTLVRGLGFDYPPLVAWLWSPLSRISHEAAVATWMWGSVICTVAGALVVAHTLLPRSWPRTSLALVASFLYGAATYNLWHGNANAVVFLLLALAMRAWVRGDQVRFGLLLGAGAALKLAPLALVVLAVRRRWWRGGLTAVGTFAVSLAAGGALVGWGSLRTFVTQVLPVLSRDDGWLQNQSWNAVLNRLTDHDVLSLQPAATAPHVIALVLGAAGLLAVAASVRPQAAAAGTEVRDRLTLVRGAEFGAGVVAMLLAGTITWYEHYVHLLVALAAAVAVIAVRGVRRERALTAAVLAVVVMFWVVAPLTMDSLTPAGVAGVRHGLFWWPWLQLFSLPALSAAALLACLLSALRRLQDGPPHPVWNRASRGTLAA